jgi:hypothetical protein
VFEGVNSIGIGNADINGDWTVTISTLANGPYTITAIQTDTSLNLSGSSLGLDVIVDTANDNTVIYTTPATETLEIGSDDIEIIIDPATSNLETIILDETANETILLDLSDDTINGNTTTISNGFDITFHVAHENQDTIPEDDSGIVTLQDGTFFTGPVTWDGVLELPTVTQISIPTETITSGKTTTTTTYTETAVFEIGLGSDSISLSEPARIEFTNDASEGFVAFFVDTDDNIIFITTTCTSDDPATGLPPGIHECSIVDGDDIVVLTDHFTKFGVSKKSTSHSSSASSGANNGGGRIGVGPGAAGTSGAVGFTGILGSSLVINEVSYDKCNDNMAEILVSSDADLPPTIKVSTAKSGVVYATLTEIQPYEDLNKSTIVDKYLYEIPISSEESFLMISVTEEKGTRNNTIQASIKLLSCEGTSIFVPLPEETLPEVSESSVRFFDTKVQIGSNSPIAASESEFLFVNDEELTISSIIDSQTPIQSVELRSITMGQADADHIAIEMDITPLLSTNTAYAVSGSIPSFLFVEPGMTYWLHITDENDAQIESTHYNIGAKPTSQLSNHLALL